MRLTERIPVSMSTEDREKLRALAATNTDGNESALIRSLVRMAYMLPSQYNLIEPRRKPEEEEGEG